ncbi:MAG TPA: caspase family protein [Burkholderiales bacterium]|nr:caspase family protein [Burkholderiales bacterium]
MRQALYAAVLALSAFAAQAAEGEAQVFVQLGHRASITSIAFAPDGRRLASASQDGTLKLWDVASGREIQTLVGHQGTVTAVAWTAEGVISAGRDRTLRTWDAAHGTPVASVLAHESVILAVAAGGSRIASAGYDGAVKLWSASLKPERSIGGGFNAAAVRSVALSRDGTRLAFGGDARMVQLFDAAEGRELRRFEGLASGILSVALSPDGARVAAGAQDGSTRVWDASSGAQERLLRGHGEAVSAVAFSADGRLLATASNDGTVRVWSLASGEEVKRLTGHRGDVLALAFSPGGKALASAGLDQAVHLWDPASGKELGLLRGRANELRGLAFAPDGGTLAVAGADRAVRLWDLQAAKMRRSLAGHAGPVNAARFSPDGRLVATASQDRTVRLWDAASGAERRVLRGHTGEVHAVAFSPDGARLASAGNDDAIRLWDVAGGAALRALTGHKGSVRQLAFSRDGTRLASASYDDTVRVWDAASGAELKVLKGHANRVNAVEFLPSGEGLVTASEDATVRIWSLASGESRILAAHKGPVRALAVSPDGATIVSAGLDGSVIYWNAASGAPLRTLGADAGALNAVAFSGARGTVAAAGSRGVTVLLGAGDARERVRFFGFDDGEWVSLSPAGYFNGSPGGFRYLNVRLGGEVHGLDQFVESFFRPDLVQLALEGDVSNAAERLDLARREREREEQARIEREKQELARLERERDEQAKKERERIEQARLERQREEQARLEQEQERLAALARPRPASQRIAEVKPAPRIEILDAPERASSAQLTVKLRVTDAGGGVGDVRLYVNGTAVLMQASRVPQDGVLSLPLRLVNGRNEIRAIAFNADNSMQSADALHEIVAALDGPRRPALYAVVVGIQEFQNPRLRLSFSVSDAELLAGVLRARAQPLFESVTIRMLLKPEETSRAALVAALEEAKARVSPEDLFVFYVASHGTVDEGEYFLVTSNVGSVSTARLRADAIGQRSLTELIANIPATKKLVVLDTCNAGKLGDAILSGLLTRGMSEDTAAKILSRAVGATILSAATSEQEALEGHEGHGLFTWVVVQGLQGGADRDRDGYVKTTELADFVDSEVPELAEKLYRRKQYPIISPSGMGFPVTRAK